MNLEPHKCPRHVYHPTFKVDELSKWEQRGKFHCCSYCGSIHPDEFMEALENGAELGATDKDYKAYLHPGNGLSQVKFYFQHLSYDQKVEFVKLYNANKIKYAGNYRFYIHPYFMAFKEPGETSEQHFE